MEYLLDTNIISEIMRREPDKKVMDWFSSLNELNMSVITYDEVIFGLNRKSLSIKLTWFNSLCADRARLINVNREIARWSGEKRSGLAHSGRTITMADSLIAGTAHECNLVLATRNIKDFKHMGIALFNPFD